MTWQARAIASLIAALGLLGLGFKFGLDVKQGEWDAAVLSGKESQERALQAAAEALRTMAPAQAKVIERITRETTRIPVYAACVNDPSVVRDINAALANQPASGEPVPRVDAP